MRFRIVNKTVVDGQWTGRYSEVYDLDSGRKIENVVAVSFEHRVNELPLLKIELVPDEVVIEGDCERR